MNEKRLYHAFTYWEVPPGDYKDNIDIDRLHLYGELDLLDAVWDAINNPKPCTFYSPRYQTITMLSKGEYEIEYQVIDTVQLHDVLWLWICDLAEITIGDNPVLLSAIELRKRWITDQSSVTDDDFDAKVEEVGHKNPGGGYCNSTAQGLCHNKTLYSALYGVKSEHRLAFKDNRKRDVMMLIKRIVEFYPQFEGVLVADD